VVVGAKKPGQVRENVERLGAAVPVELWERLRAEGLVKS
jgi:aryl-alcohol dehydrogenase-like predicted oxidoreductase